MEKKYTVEGAGPKIDAFLKSTFQHAGFKLKFVIAEGENPHPDFENPELVVKFSGDDVDLLLANKGELLLALEQLTMEALRMLPEEHSRICFDANDYRLMRIEELRISALTAADKVKKTHSPFRFNPMTSRERRIIHLALRNDDAVRSESAGVGPFRQVVIYPYDMPSAPEPVRPPRSGGPGGPRGGPGGRPPMRRGRR